MAIVLASGLPSGSWPDDETTFSTPITMLEHGRAIRPYRANADRSIVLDMHVSDVAQGPEDLSG